MMSENKERKKNDFEDKRENVSLVVRKGEMRNMLAQEPKFVLMCKGMCLAIEPKTDDALPSAFKSILLEFNDIST